MFTARALRTARPTIRQLTQRRLESTLQGPADNAFNRERQAVKEHAAATSGMCCCGECVRRRITERGRGLQRQRWTWYRAEEEGTVVLCAQRPEEEGTWKGEDCRKDRGSQQGHNIRTEQHADILLSQISGASSPSSMTTLLPNYTNPRTTNPSKRASLHITY